MNNSTVAHVLHHKYLLLLSPNDILKTNTIFFLKKWTKALDLAVANKHSFVCQTTRDKQNGESD